MEKQFERELIDNLIKLSKPSASISAENIINFSIKASEYCQSISEIPSEYIDEDFEELRYNVVKSMCDLQFDILNKMFKNKTKQD